MESNEDNGQPGNKKKRFESIFVPENRTRSPSPHPGSWHFNKTILTGSNPKKVSYLGTIGARRRDYDSNPIIDGGAPKSIGGIHNITRLCKNLDYHLIIEDPRAVYYHG